MSKLVKGCGRDKSATALRKRQYFAITRIALYRGGLVIVTFSFIFKIHYLLEWRELCYKQNYSIVSISQPYIRPIVRGKAKSPVEFGAKLDLSVDETGMCRIEKLSFDAYNEGAVLKTAIAKYKERTGHYPERVLVDQIYRNRENISYCSNLGIRLSGRKLGRPKKDADSKAGKKIAYQDNTDRIEVERKFSLAKRKFGLGLLLTKREDTTRASIVLSIIAMNIDRLVAMLLRFIQFLLNFGLSYGRLERPWYYGLIEGRLNSGLADDWPSNLCKPIPEEFRSNVILNDENNLYHKGIQVKEGFINFPKNLMLACYDNGTVLISYKKSLTQPRMVLTERSLYKTIKLFFDYIMRFETN